VIFGLRSREAEARHCYANRLGWTREIIARPHGIVGLRARRGRRTSRALAQASGDIREHWPSPVTRRLFQKPRLIGRPLDDRLPDFPLVTERIENATELPAVLDGHGGGLGRSRGHRLLNERMRIVDNEESTAGSPVDAAWIEALHGRRRRGDPEGSTPHGELGDDVIAFTYEMERACTERRFVERDRFARFVNPKFRLDSRHEPRR
jgi:hypothetical protein